MSIRFDEKGKFFTSVVSKEPIRVVIQTVTHRIEGNIFKRPDERIKETVNQEEQFIAVTDLTIKVNQSQEIFQSDFLLVNRDQVVWILPVEKPNSE
jgi:tyrosine-protein phosphatase YwqE